MSVFKDLMWFFKMEKKSYLMGIFLLSCVAFLELIPPKIIGLIVDSIKNETLTRPFLIKWLSILFSVAVIMYILRFFWRIMIFGPAVRLARLLRNQLFEHFTSMNQTFYQKRRVGDLMAHSTNDLKAIQQTAGQGILTLVDSLTLGGFVLVAMATTISWKLTLISLIPMPFMALSTSYYGTLLHKTFHKAQEAFSSLNEKTQESVSGIKVIKTFGQESEDIEEFRNKSSDVVTKNIAVAKIDSLFDPTISLIVGISFFLAVSFGAKFVIQEELSIGQLITFTTYLGLLIWPMLAFGWLFNIVERGRASYDRVFSLLSDKMEINNLEGIYDESPIGDIEFAVEHFSYPTSHQQVLKNIQFTLKSGETLGIVGKTGAGKTTILKLLLREYEGYKGSIRFGNHQIEEYQLQSLRRAIGYVPQDHFLFSSTVSDNIAFAKPQASMTNVIDAAKLAHIHEDISRFTNGYETLVGERGVSLSGGQKQRISIARALIMEPELLILDDSLSAVDAKTEEQILASLRTNRSGKTTIITSHRLSAISHADLILVIEDGRVVQKGTHVELMKMNGWYNEMFVRQQLESLVEKGG